MSTREFNQTNIPGKYSMEIAERTAGMLTLAASDVEILVKVLLSGIANHASFVFTKDKPAAVVIDDVKGNPLLSAIIRYYEPSEDEADENDTGNFIFEFSFDPEDIKDCVRYNLSDPKNHRAILDASALAGIRYAEPNCVFLAVNIFADTLKNWLDENATSEEEVEVELEDYFTASVEINTAGNKVFSMVPHGALKRILKNDLLKQK